MNEREKDRYPENKEGSSKEDVHDSEGERPELLGNKE